MSEYKDRRKVEPWENWMLIAALVLVVLLVLVCGTGCCAQREIIRRQTDTLYVEKVQVDSIYKRDSVMVREKGDTVYIYKEKIRDRYRYIHGADGRRKLVSSLVWTEKGRQFILDLVK